MQNYINQTLLIAALGMASIQLGCSPSACEIRWAEPQDRHPAQMLSGYSFEVVLPANLAYEASKKGDQPMDFSLYRLVGEHGLAILIYEGNHPNTMLLDPGFDSSVNPRGSKFRYYCPSKGVDVLPQEVLFDTNFQNPAFLHVVLKDQQYENEMRVILSSLTIRSEQTENIGIKEK